MNILPRKMEEEISSSKSKTKPRVKAKPRSKKETGSTNTKTIKAPGTLTERVAQACDRCRAKKTKCDGKRPACSSCAAVGIECIVSDKLSRRAFPKGYTEILEERIRQLESENKKLVGLLDLRDEQLGILNGIKQEDDSNAMVPNEQKITTSNLSLLDETHEEHKHFADCPCGCSNPHILHERPVSIAGSIYSGKNGAISIANSINLSDDDDDNNSLISYDEMISVNSFNPLLKNYQISGNFSNKEGSPAPGAFAAATAIAQMQRNRMQLEPQKSQQESENNKQQSLTNLVALSIPRSTKETLFIPTLLARICQVYGYNSKPPILTANAIASLKENSNEAMKNSYPSNRDTDMLLNMISNREGILKLDEAEARYFVCKLINLPPSRVDLDQLISTYFSEWGSLFPVVDKNSFLKNYVLLTNILDSNNTVPPANFPQFESIEKFGAMLVLVISLSLLANKSNYLNVNGKNENVGKFVSYLNHYDFLIHEFIRPTCIITKHCSIQSLQILTLSFLYCLVIGDVTTCYELRGRVISMAQQLRLHRCPAAVLGISGDNGDNIHLQNFMQGERRILFWCIYSLDIYSSLNLGVPRLLKDFEIECAMPFAGKNDDDDDDDNENILIVNNTKLSIVGKVPRLALSFMQFCKVLGKIMDSIFSRFDNDDAQSRALDQDRMLDCWRRDLPIDLKFDIDVNGFSVKDGNSSNGNSWNGYSKQQLKLVFLYYHAKVLIYLPIISKYGNHHNVGLSTKEKLLKGDRDISSIVSSISMIQQSSIQILEILKSLSSSSNFLPIPINIAREQARFALLVAMGSLDYIKGGPLYQNSKNLLLSTVSSLSIESNYGIPGGLTKNSVKIFELAILSILGLSLNKGSIRKKSPLSSQPITKMAVSREPPQQKQFPIQSKFPIATNYDSNNEEFMNNIYMNSSNSSLEMDNNASNQIDDLEGLESILKFDPFKVKHSVNEFAADGSLGLVPFLDNDMMLNIYNNTARYDQTNINSKNSTQSNGDLFEWP